MKWLNRTLPVAVPVPVPVPVPAKQSPLSSRSITIEPDPSPRNSGLAQAIGEESDQTQKSAIPDEIQGEPTPAPTIRPASRRNPGRHHSPTLASPIPAILAESMGLAKEDPSARPSEPLAKTPPERH